jgi:hypothetical protein
MYRKNKIILANKEDLGNYIEDYDAYNSLLLLRLSDVSLERESYQITTYEYRPDLIAKDYYSSETYLPYVLLQGGRSIDEYKKGSILRLIPKEILDSIIASI